MSDFILTTQDTVANHKVVETLGYVKGNTIRAKHIGRDIMAGFKQIVGGEIVSYTKLLSEARQEAVERMIAEAKDKGANAIVGMKFTTSAVMAGAAELLAYGTAVKVEPE